MTWTQDNYCQSAQGDESAALLCFVMSTSGWDLIGMATYLQTSQMDTLFLCMCECKYSVALN